MDIDIERLKKDKDLIDEQYLDYIGFCMDSNVDFSEVIPRDKFVSSGVMGFLAQSIVTAMDDMMVMSAGAIADLYGESVHELAARIHDRMDGKKAN